MYSNSVLLLIFASSKYDEGSEQSEQTFLENMMELVLKLKVFQETLLITGFLLKENKILYKCRFYKFYTAYWFTPFIGSVTLDVRTVSNIKYV